MNKPVYFGLSVLESSKMLMYAFWYDYVKPNYGEKARLCYMDTDSFIFCIKTDGIYKYVIEDVETRFGTSNYELECNPIDRPLPKGKIEKVIGLMKDELVGTIMVKVVRLTKTYSYLIDYGSEDKNTKGTKTCVIKTKLKFENYKNCLEANQLENNHLEKKKIEIDSIKKEKIIKSIFFQYLKVKNLMFLLKKLIRFL